MVAKMRVGDVVVVVDIGDVSGLRVKGVELRPSYARWGLVLLQTCSW